MSKLFALLLFSLTLLSSAQSGRLGRRQRVQFFVRQAEPAATPYPSAEELKPVQPFEDGSDGGRKPDAFYGAPPADGAFNIPQPDAVYGAPELVANDLDHVLEEEQLPVLQPAESYVPSVEAFPPAQQSDEARLLTARRRARTFAQQPSRQHVVQLRYVQRRVPQTPLVIRRK